MFCVHGYNSILLKSRSKEIFDNCKWDHINSKRHCEFVRHSGLKLQKKCDSLNPNPSPLKGNIFENVWSLDEVKKDFFDQHYSLNFFPFLAHFLYRRGYNYLLKKEAQNCNQERHTSMVLFTGHFSTHECEIELNNFSCKDVGIWTCQMNKGKFYGLKKLNVTSINHCT